MECFAAHIREEAGIESIQSVAEHCRNTAEDAGRYALDIHAPNMAKLQGMIHDLGKLCVDFNNYIRGKNNFQRGMIDHCFAGARYVREFAEKTKNPKLIETADFVARTVISHHGLHDWLDENGESYYFRRIYKEDRYEEIKANIHCMISEEEMTKLLEAAGDEYAHVRKKIRLMSPDKEKFAFYMGQWERLMQSILIDADRTDTGEFQLGLELEKEYDSGIWNVFGDRIEAKAEKFAKQTDTISRLRSNISDRCRDFSEKESGICRMIVPTGGGKTISSFRFAINYCRKHGKNRIFYIAPYMSILEQNSDVLKEIVGEEYLLEHHSDIAAEMENAEEIEEYELRSDKWDMPVIATTMVQFLNTLFSDRLECVRRMHRLCNAVIIIDEVQSVPTKCVSLFNMGMNFLAEIGRSCVVLCSATQPTFENTKYPLNVAPESSMTGDYSSDFQAFKRNEICSKVRTEGYSYEEAADFCVEKYEEEGNVLFIVNTKTAAYCIYQELKQKITDGTQIVHISTNMCPEHRRKVIRDLKEMLQRHQKVVCVTTQLIEAGVDISFHCVIRSLAGLDNAAQAAGRCNRNGEYEECCRVYLLNLQEERLGRLKDIRTARSVSEQMIQNHGYPDLQSVDTMRAYFNKYYMEQKEELEYNAEDIGIQTDLVHLLSIDQHRRGSGREISYYTGQAFKTAGRKFHVIDDASASVLVPYNEEAESIISRLRSNIRDDEIVKIHRKAQKYVVGIFETTEKKLIEEHALELLPCGIYVLDERYYDRDSGILLEGKPMDLLMF
ncbi:MAG: CRISPR-associated helicase Cas3' [Fusicatenibacter sp.]|nr:CRISPR-associated helicase Cas3' [Fusicatenibacter sp.]